MPADDILDQADALMRRHRSFIARATEGTDAARENVEAQETEIPLLTEVVDTSEVVAQDIETIIAALRSEIDEAMSAWLVDVLPVAVANASQQILSELDAKARNTLLPRLQQILAEHTGQTRQTSLPDQAEVELARDPESPSV